MPGLREVAKQAGVSTNQVKSVFAAIINLLAVSDGEDNGRGNVKIQGFGSFRSSKLPARTLTSPVISDGAPVEIVEQHTVKFKLAPASKNRLNKMLKRKEKLMADPPKKAIRPKGGK